MLNQHALAGLVAVVHRLQLGAGDVGLVHHQQPVLGEVIDQAFRRGPRLPASEMARIVLDAVAVTDLLEHLEVVGGALLQALGLQQLALLIEDIEALPQFRANGLDRVLQALLGGHEVLGRIDADGLQALEDFTGGGVHVADGLDLIAEELDPHQAVFIGGPDLEHITPHPEASAGDFEVVAGVLVVDQLPQGAAQVEGFPHLKFDGGLEVFTRNPQAVNTTDGGDDDHIAALKERAGRGVPQHVDLFVDRRRFGDVGIGDGHIRLRLVVVVVRDEVLNGVLRKELPELITELGRQGFVVGQDQSRPAGLGNDVGDGEGLTGSRRPQQGLIALARFHASHERLDRLGLIPFGLVGSVDFKRVRHRAILGQPPRRRGCPDNKKPMPRRAWVRSNAMQR